MGVSTQGVHRASLRERYFGPSTFQCYWGDRANYPIHALLRGQVGFPLLLNKALKWGQESCIWGLYKLDFVEEGHVQSGHVGFPLPLNKALNWGQEAWIWGLSQLDFMEEGHVQSGQVEASFVVLMWALLLRRATRQVTGILG